MTERLPLLRDRLRKAAHALSVPIDAVEFDYGLSYVLAAIFARPELREVLVFKGGTAHEKAYFAGYRFSRDLDFTAVGGPRGDELERTVEAVARDTEQMLSDHGPFAVTSARRTERSAHPSGQEAFLLQIQFPWHRSLPRTIKVEVTVDEPLALAPEALGALVAMEESRREDSLLGGLSLTRTTVIWNTLPVSHRQVRCLK